MGQQLLYIDPAIRKCACSAWGKKYEVWKSGNLYEADGLRITIPFMVIMSEARIHEQADGYDYLVGLRETKVETPLVLYTDRPKTDFPKIDDLSITYVERTGSIQELMDAVDALLA